jgi:hypothetical protein
MARPGEIYAAMRAEQPKPTWGQLRVWWVPQVPGKPFHWVVPNLDAAGKLLDALAAYDDFQFAQGVRGDYCNAGGLEFYKGAMDGGWHDWYDPSSGLDFDDWRRGERLAAVREGGSLG